MHKKYANADIFLASKLRQDLHRLKLKEEGDPINFVENISASQMQSRTIYKEMISEKEIYSKIITAALKIHMPVIRTLQKEKVSDL